MWKTFLLAFLSRTALCQLPQEPPFYGVLGQRPQPVTATPSAQEQQVVVKIAPGEIRGRRVYIPKLPWLPDRDWREQVPHDRNPQVGHLPRENTVEIFQFLGIPYAEKPVGNLRFKLPQRLTTFPNRAIDAFDYPNSCAQDVQKIPTPWPFVSPHVDRPYPWTVDEDCLYLNVFTPETSQQTQRNFPVIVFFHGGNFQTGTANEWPGHVLASKGLVVVTVNYRLGAFGFMTLGNWPVANMGLYDQRVALEWVRDYVYTFNGDPNRVLVVGHGSGGGASVGLHMLSPKSTGLFYAAAALSGADVSYHSVIYDKQLAFNNTVRLGRESGCAQTTPSATYDCLLGKSTNDIIIATASLRLEYNRYAFLPVVDNTFLPDTPRNMLEHRQLASPVPYLTGINQCDGSEVLFEDRQLAESGGGKWRVGNNYVMSKIIRYVLQHNYTTNRDAVIQAIKYLYTYWPDPLNDERMREEYIKMNTDAYYAAPVQLSARMHADAGSISFMYVNNYRLGYGSFNPEKKGPFPEWLGPHHEEDLYLLFGFPFMPRELLPQTFPRYEMDWTQMDRNVSDNFMESIRQFAKRKDPNLPLEQLWNNLNIRELNYLDFNVSRKMKKDYDWEHISFWNIYIDQVAELWTTTLDPTVASMKRELEIMKGISATFIVLTSLAVVVVGALAYMLSEKLRYVRRRPILLQHHELEDSTMGEKV